MNNHQYYFMIQQFTLFSDFFMYAVFSRSKPAITLLARILTGKPDLVVKRWGMEVKKGMPFFRHVRYDLFVEDMEGNLYNFEIENGRRALGQRALFNLSVLVSHMLKPNEPFCALNESWVVFLTRKDFMRRNEPFYTYEWFDRKWKRILHTKAHIRFVNGEYRGDDAIGKLMHDFHCTNPDDMFYDELREAVSYFKKEPKGVNAMCEIMREFEKESRNKGRAEERKKAKKRMEAIMRKLYAKGMDCPTIAEVTGQTVSKVETFFQKQALNKG